VGSQNFPAYALCSPFPAAVVRRSLAKHTPRVLDPHFVGDAGARQPHELGEWRVRPTC